MTIKTGNLTHRFKRFIPIFVLITIFLMPGCSNTDASKLAEFPLEKALANGKPTLAEFGWRECIPCKAMRPILEELAEEFKGRLNVLIVEIPYHQDLAEKYQVMVMPVQIFFDSSGREIVRHAGFLPKEAIVDQIKTMGVEK